MNQWVKTLVITLGTGLLMGIMLGVVIYLASAETDFGDLQPDDQLTVTILFAESYLEHGDFDRLQRDLSLFRPPNAGEFVMLMAERAISTQQPRQQICALVHVSARYGYLTDAMSPYVECAKEASNEALP